MRRTALFLCAILCAVCLRAQADTIRVLAIGNSFSQDALEQYLYELGHEVGVEMIIGNGYRGGQGFASHWKDVTEENNTFEYRKVTGGVRTNRIRFALKTILEDEPWDFITVQQASPESGLYGTYEPCMTELLQYAAALCPNPDVRFGFHMTWAYSHDSTHGGFANYGSNQQAMYDSINSSVQRAMAAHPDLTFLVPSGTAIQNARASWLGDNMDRDGYHLDLKFGRYTAACTWLECLTGHSPVGLRYSPLGVDPVAALTCQIAAHKACAAPHAVSDMADVGYALVNDIRPVGKVKLNFGDETCGDRSWNNISTGTRTYTRITDEYMHPTGITLTATQPMAGSNRSGASYTVTRMLMPQGVSESAVWGYASGKFEGAQPRPMAEYTLGHLNPDLKYDFTIFASRQDCKDFRQTTFVVQGRKSQAESLDAANNTSEVVRIKGVRPSEDGRITLSVMPGTRNTNVHRFYYLNAIIVRAH